MTVGWRSVFLYPFFLGMVTAPIAITVGLLHGGSALQWAGLAVAAAPMLWFFKGMASKRIARFPPALPVQVVAGAVGAVLTVLGALVWDPIVSPAAVAHSLLLGGLAIPLYTFGYSKLPTGACRIVVGECLPQFTMQSMGGGDVSSVELAPAILMFFRGNWCPLCMAQIHEVAEQYKELERRGVTVALISGQPQQETEKLAKQFDVPFLHFVDEGLRVARQLGLLHERALPAGLAGRIGASDDSAYLPTVVVTDRDGLVVLCAETDNYRVRPEPSTFMKALDDAGVGEVPLDEAKSVGGADGRRSRQSYPD